MASAPRAMIYVRRMSTTPIQTPPSTAVLDFAKAMERFRLEREKTLRSTLQVLERVREKESKGIPPRRIENLVSELVAPPASRSGTGMFDPSPRIDRSLSSSSKIRNDIETILSVRQPVDRLKRKARPQHQQLRSLNPTTNIQLVQYFERTDTFRVRITVPKATLSMLIGKHAWRVRKMGLDTGCVVSVVDTAPATASNDDQQLQEQQNRFPFVQLVGNEAQIRLGYERVAETVEYILKYQIDEGFAREVPLVVKMASPEEKSTTFIQDVVRDIKKLSGTFIKMYSNQVIRIWGSPDQVDFALRITALLQNDNLLSFKAVYNDQGDGNPNILPPNLPAYFLKVCRRVPDGMIPLLMGTASATVRRLKTESGADIKFADDANAVTLYGSPRQVMIAWGLIDAFLDEHSKYIAGVDWKKQVALRDRRDMQILIGKNFSGIRKLQQITGCFIRVSDPKDPAMTIRLWGRPDQVEHALKSMFAILKYGSASIT